MNNELLKSFKIQDELNPRIWDKDGSSYTMKKIVRNRLLEIANEFIKFLDVDILVTDIIMVGSLSNYNWSKYSDVDLHILINFNQFPENTKELYTEFFGLKKMLFTQKHDIKIYGFDVEGYVQSEEESNISSGTYSILYDKWVTEPKKETSTKVDTKLLKDKSKKWMNIIDNVVDNIDDETPEKINEIVKTYKAKLKKYRKCGLEKNGEMAIENLVFKVLRRNGYIEKLYTLPTKVIDRKLSLKELNFKQF
jgi:predicted nucleotidyltransferase